MIINILRTGLLWIPLGLFAPHAFASLTAGDSPLLQAISRNQTEQALRILRESPDRVHSKQPDGMTALHWAAHHGNAAIVDALLKQKAEVDPTNEYGVTPLFLAVAQGHHEIVHTLLHAGSDSKQLFAGQESLLMHAARQGEPKTVRALLDSGADSNHRDAKGQTALMWAASAGNNEALAALLRAKADVHAVSKVGFTALHFAARDGQMEAVRQLVEAGADVNTPMKVSSSNPRAPRQGTSPLILAVESGHYQVALTLVQLGADPNDQRSGFTPLHVLTWVRRPKSGDDVDGDPPPNDAGPLSSLQFVEEIVRLGARVDEPIRNAKAPGKAKINANGATPLLFASKNADLPFMKLLIQLGADPLRSNDDGCTPILAMAGVGTVAVDEEPGTESEVLEGLAYLLSLGADLNHVDKNKESAMHGAAYRAYPQVVRFLARKGLRISSWNHANRHGWTPMKIAEGSRPGSVKPSPAVIEALREILQEG
ncbi:MAG: ankyrin repeat domain-containing protein [Pirellulales bacterium]